MATFGWPSFLEFHMNDSAAFWLEKAGTETSRQDWQAAIDSYQRALELRPNSASILLQLSIATNAAGHYRQASDYALAAGRRFDTDPRLAATLLPHLRLFNHVPVLLDYLERLKPLERMPIPLLLAFASQLSSANMQKEALGLLDEARRADPDFPPTLVSRAQVLMYMGHFANARRDLLKCLQRAPEIAQAWWLLSRLDTQSHEANQIDALRRIIASRTWKPHEAAFLHFALHKNLDDVGEYDDAWQSLRQACQVVRSATRYDHQRTLTLFRKLRAWAPTATHPSTADAPPSIPIFIVGMHRSGTTLVEQILSGHSGVHAGGELYDFTCAMRHATDHPCSGVVDSTIVERAHSVDFTEVGQHYLKSIAWRTSGKSRTTDKLPTNFLNLGFILSALPDAKILHTHRDPLETCFSNLREFFGGANPHSYDIAELASYHREYKELMRHWEGCFPGMISSVDYDRLTATPEPVVRAMTDYCGIGFQAHMLSTEQRQQAVATASAVQVRGAIAHRATPKWKHYERYLQPLIDALQ